MVAVKALIVESTGHRLHLIGVRRFDMKVKWEVKLEDGYRTELQDAGI
jgi:hypothetical protein